MALERAKHSFQCFQQASNQTPMLSNHPAKEAKEIENTCCILAVSYPL